MAKDDFEEKMAHHPGLATFFILGHVSDGEWLALPALSCPISTQSHEAFVCPF